MPCDGFPRKGKEEFRQSAVYLSEAPPDPFLTCFEFFIKPREMQWTPGIFRITIGSSISRSKQRYETNKKAVGQTGAEEFADFFRMHLLRWGGLIERG